jgi:hypothetical protein
MFVGLSFLIFSAIRGEETGKGARGGKLSAIKKILLNFMQMVSLAAGLPLRWTPAIQTMFQTMDTISSAGTTLLIPDCELSQMKSADAFYLKQIVYTCAIPIVVMGSIISWSLLYFVCARRCKLKLESIKHRMILTMTLLLFLCYPLLVKLCLSMFKCATIGGIPYLVADLQDACFVDRHLQYVMLLSVPQLIILTCLPILFFLLLRVNKKHLENANFRLRYGLLYHGYVKGREWWEGIIALRKISIVAIGTFGTLMGVGKLNIWIMVIC